MPFFPIRPRHLREQVAVGVKCDVRMFSSLFRRGPLDDPLHLSFRLEMSHPLPPQKDDGQISGIAGRQLPIQQATLDDVAHGGAGQLLIGRIDPPGQLVL